jgi:TetR/AcrR family transcriptional regulator, transcriptional repressor for nem operon
MKITKAQAQANRVRIIETASTLFRERGYDGVGVADIMAAAGFTHGGFYKHFGSKADLMVEAASCGLEQTAMRSEGMGIVDFVRLYVSRKHRDARSEGCTMAALGGDAARQPDSIKATFEDGIERLIANLEKDSDTLSAEDRRDARAKVLSVLAHSVGALVLSRACPDDSALADEILKVCQASILAQIVPEPHDK